MAAPAVVVETAEPDIVEQSRVGTIKIKAVDPALPKGRDCAADHRDGGAEDSGNAETGLRAVEHGGVSVFRCPTIAREPPAVLGPILKMSEVLLIAA